MRSALMPKSYPSVSGVSMVVLKAMGPGFLRRSSAREAAKAKRLEVGVDSSGASSRVKTTISLRSVDAEQSFDLTGAGVSVQEKAMGVGRAKSPKSFKVG